MLVSLQCKLLYDIADKMILRLYFSIFREISCLASASHFPFFVWKMFFPFIWLSGSGPSPPSSHLSSADLPCRLPTFQPEPRLPPGYRRHVSGSAPTALLPWPAPRRRPRPRDAGAAPFPSCRGVSKAPPAAAAARAPRFVLRIGLDSPRLFQPQQQLRCLIQLILSLSLEGFESNRG